MTARKTVPAQTAGSAPRTRTRAPQPRAIPVASKAVAKPSKSASAAPPKKAAAPVTPLPEQKPKLVRDSFTIPKAEYAVIEQLKRRASVLERPAKKSELLRAGIKALSALSDSALLAALQAVPTIKTGRPKR